MKKYQTLLSFIIILLFASGCAVFIYASARQLSPQQKLAGAAAATPTGGTCCFAVYGIDNPGQSGMLQKTAQTWLNNQSGCSTKQIFPAANFNSDELKGQYNCSSVSVFHAEHGPICAKVANVAQVCVDSFGCNISVHSLSCQSFKDIPTAQQYIASLQSSLKGQQTVSVTGQQYYGWMDSNPSEYAFDEATFTVTATQTNCSVGECSAAGLTCGPIGSSAQCKDEGGSVVTQNCCPVDNSISSITGQENGVTADPGQTCANAKTQGVCTGDPSNWNLSHGVECPNQWTSGMTQDVPAQLVQTCTTNSMCQYTCGSGSVYVPATATAAADCSLGNTCINQPNNATMCDPINGDQGLTGETQSKLVDSCLTGTSATDKCTFICNIGYIKQGDVCVPDPAGMQTPDGCDPMIITATVKDSIGNLMPNTKVQLIDTSANPNVTFASTTDATGNVVFQNLAMLIFKDKYSLTALSPNAAKYDDSNPVAIATNVNTQNYASTLELLFNGSPITDITVTPNPASSSSITNTGTGSIATINWKAPDFRSTQTYRIDLMDSTGHTLIKNITPSTTLSSAGYSWNGDPSIPAGQYKIKITAVVPGVTSSSPTTFLNLSPVFNLVTLVSPVVTITSNTGLTPATAIASGSNITLAFTINYGNDPTTSCNASGAWGPGLVGILPSSQTQPIQNVTTTSTYTLTCTNRAGTNSASVTVYTIAPTFTLTSTLVPPVSGAACAAKTFTISLNPTTPLPSGFTYTATIYTDYNVLGTLTSPSQTLNATITTNTSGVVVSASGAGPFTYPLSTTAANSPLNQSAKIVLINASGAIVGTYYSNIIYGSVPTGVCNNGTPAFTLSGTAFGLAMANTSCVPNNTPFTVILSGTNIPAGTNTYAVTLYAMNAVADYIPLATTDTSSLPFTTSLVVKFPSAGIPPVGSVIFDGKNLGSDTGYEPVYAKVAIQNSAGTTIGTYTSAIQTVVTPDYPINTPMCK